MQFRQFIIQKIKSYYLVIAYKSPIYHVYGIPYTTANCMSRSAAKLMMFCTCISTGCHLTCKPTCLGLRSEQLITWPTHSRETPSLPPHQCQCAWMLLNGLSCGISTYITQSVCISSKIRMVPTGYCYDCNYVFYLRIQGQPNGQHYNVHMHWWILIQQLCNWLIFPTQLKWNYQH